MPDGPYSFSGKLITLAWAIEIVVLPGGESTAMLRLMGSQYVERVLVPPLEELSEVVVEEAIGPEAKPALRALS